MQENDKKSIFKNAVGEVLKDLRLSVSNVSINKLANEFDFDKGTLSKIERGFYSIQLDTAWKLAEANNVKFSEFAKRLEQKLGKDFKFIDE